MPVIPSVQSTKSAEPNTSIPVRENGSDEGVKQALVRRKRGDGKVAKPVEAVRGSDPNIAFTILKEIVNVIAREPVRLGKYIGPSLVHVHNALARGCDPQTAIAIAEQQSDFELPQSTWERIGLGFPTSELSDSAVRPYQECAVIAFTET